VGLVPRVDPPLPPVLAQRPFTLAEAADAGIADTELRRARLRIPTSGVRVTGDAPGLEDVRRRCREVLPVLPADAVFCHGTALALLGLDLPFGVDLHDRHGQVGPGTAWPRRAGLHGHSRSSADVPHLVLREGVRALLPELVWVQLAGDLPVRELVVLGDTLLRRRAPVSSLDRLRQTVDDLPAGTRGRRRLGVALERIRPRTDSCMESRLRWMIVDAGLPSPVVNEVVRRPSGEVVAMPDLSYPGMRVAIEYDGDVHRTDRATWRRDTARRQELEHLGWRMVTCTADDVLRTPDRTLDWIRSALRRAALTSRLQDPTA
jgi:hypothetical protein